MSFNSEIEREEMYSKIQKDEEQEDIKDEHSHYLNQAEILKQKYIKDYEDEVEMIRANYKDETNIILQQGKDLCKEMVEIQRSEANNLENEWRTARQRQIDQETESYNSRLETAKVLANYNAFEAAKSLKSKVEKRSHKRSKELKMIDSLYLKQYKLMVQRHEKEFSLLLERVKARISSSKKDAEFLKKRADATKTANDSQIPVVIISSVAVQAKHEETKKQVLHSFSPRRNHSESFTQSPK